MRPAVFFRLRLRLSLQNTAELLNPDSLTHPGTKPGGWSVARSLSGRDEVLWVTSPNQEQWLKDDGVLKIPLRMTQGSLVAESCEIDETKFQVRRIAQVETKTKEK